MRERRLVFGEVAELYDAHRPSYPAALIDDLVQLAGLDGRDVVLEVGAGTGKATRLFAQRGIPVLAIEPSAEMAAVAQRGCADYPRVRVQCCDFERFEPEGATFPLVFAAQSWHWVAPAPGLAKAAQVLAPGGVLAPFWNRVVWAQCSAREVLAQIYRRIVPELDPADDAMHPRHALEHDGVDWETAIEEAAGLSDAEVRSYAWSQTYTAERYVGLLATHSAVRMLTPERRDALLDAVGAAVSSFELPMRTRLCLARRI